MSCNLHIQVKNSFSAGETLEGEVILFAFAELHVIRVDISFSGKENVDSKFSFLPETIKRIFEKKRQTLYGIEESKNSHDGEAPVVLSQGKHTWKFSFPIPSNIPASMDNKFVKVLYKVKATVRTLMRKNIRFSKVIRINGPTAVSEMDNNEYTLKNKYFFESAEGIILSAKMENRMLKAGDPIQVHIELQNSTHREVKTVTVKVKTAVESAIDATTTTEIERDCHEPFVFPLENGSWSYDFSAKLPERMLPTVNYSSFFKVKHYVTVALKLFPNKVRLRIPYYVFEHPTQH